MLLAITSQVLHIMTETFRRWTLLVYSEKFVQSSLRSRINWTFHKATKAAKKFLKTGKTSVKISSTALSISWFDIRFTSFYLLKWVKLALFLFLEQIQSIMKKKQPSGKKQKNKYIFLPQQVLVKKIYYFFEQYGSGKLWHHVFMLILDKMRSLLDFILPLPIVSKTLCLISVCCK